MNNSSDPRTSLDGKNNLKWWRFERHTALWFYTKLLLWVSRLRKVILKATFLPVHQLTGKRQAGQRDLPEGIALVIRLWYWLCPTMTKRERRPPTKSWEVGGLMEDCFSDDTPHPPAHCFFLCKVNISWPRGGKPAASTGLGMDNKSESVCVFGAGLTLSLCPSLYFSFSSGVWWGMWSCRSWQTGTDYTVA